MCRALLKVAEACSGCGEALYHPRADDVPAYGVIVMVGHMLVPLVPLVEKPFELPYWVHVARWMPVDVEENSNAFFAPLPRPHASTGGHCRPRR